jgi:large subunit ribosomal protein L21
MFAVVETGGKQYKVALGDKLKVEKLVAETGDSVSLDKVLMVSDGDDVQVGNPVIEGRSVTATVLEQGKHDKIRVFKMKRRKGYRRTQGHRQQYTELEITAI